MTARRIAAKPVMDGSRIKWTLEQVRMSDPGLVRLDWLRFTLPLDAVLSVAAGEAAEWTTEHLIDRRTRSLVRECRGAETVYSTGPVVARLGAEQLVKLLGDGWECGVAESRGMDYYSSRCTVLFQGHEVAHVLAGSRDARQAGTVHFNLFGGAMLHLFRPEYEKLHGWVSHAKGWITRVDLALDVWEGLDVEKARSAYLGGDFDVRGKRPGQREHGSWTLGHSRTFEVGSRDTGKLCRIYEKGDEVFGPEVNDPWVRVEVEVRNNNRVIDLAVLRNPADYFAGAYSFCEDILRWQQGEFAATRIPTKARLVEATVNGEAARLVAWFKRTAAPTCAALLVHCGEAFDEILMGEAWRAPGRMAGWSREQFAAALRTVTRGFAPPGQAAPVGA